MRQCCESQGKTTKNGRQRPSCAPANIARHMDTPTAKNLAMPAKFGMSRTCQAMLNAESFCKALKKIAARLRRKDCVLMFGILWRKEV